MEAGETAVVMDLSRRECLQNSNTGIEQAVKQQIAYL